MPDRPVKRPRSGTYLVTDSDEEDVKLPDRFHPLFNYFNADVVLRSQDGVLFAVRESVLAGSSIIFEDMFEVGRRSSSDVPKDRLTGQAAPVPLPLVRLSEPAVALQTYLSWIHQTTYPDAFQLFMDEWRHLEEVSVELIGLLDCASKFESPSISLPIFALIKEASLHSEPENIVAMGIVYDRKELVKAGMYSWLMKVEESSRRGARHSDPCISRVWPSLVDRLPNRGLVHIAIAVKAFRSTSGGPVLFGEMDRRLDAFMKAYAAGFPSM